MITYASVQDVARALAVSPQTVIREIISGRLEAVRIRRQYRVGMEALRRYLDGMNTKRGAAQ